MDSKLAKYSLGISLLLLALLWAGHELQGVSSMLATIVFMTVIFCEVYAPIYLLDNHKLSLHSYGLYAHRLEGLLDFPKNSLHRIDRPALWEELRFFGLFSLGISVLYIPAYFLAKMFFAEDSSAGMQVTLAFPPDLIKQLFLQTFAIALPEEFFYRGFLQNSLLKKWPNRTFLGPLPLGQAIIITNIMFALSHFVAAFNPLRLLTFFPGLLFSYLAFRRGSLISPILFHAFCNLLGQTLYLSLTFN